VVASNWSPAGGRGLGYVCQRHVVEGQPINGWCLLAAFALPPVRHQQPGSL
jgi:hypothetical protein